MSRPRSFHKDPFLSFDRAPDALFSDGFVHNRPLTVRIAQMTAGGNIELNGYLSKLDNNFKHTGDISLWFSIPDRSSSICFKSEGGFMRLHYDHGVRDLQEEKGWKIHPFGSVECDHQLKYLTLKGGAIFDFQEWGFTSRLRLEQDGHLSYAKRAHWARGPWRIEGYKATNLNNWTILCNALRLRFCDGANEFIAKAAQNNHRRLRDFKFNLLESYYNEFAVGWIRALDDNTKIGMEANFTTKQFGALQMAIEKTNPSSKSVWRVRASTYRSVALAYQSIIEGYGRWTLGVGLEKLGQANEGRTGVQLELNL